MLFSGGSSSELELQRMRLRLEEACQSESGEDIVRALVEPLLGGF